MKKILVLGSAVADVIIRLEDHLPVRGEDVHVLSQEMRLGGCAFNVFDAARHLDENVIPFFPIGSGPYADFVAGEFDRRGITSAAPRPAEANGCCYCFIEADGERTFVVYHGAEYRFRKDWFDALDTSQIDMCYVCGLEIEESTGPVVTAFLEANPRIQVFFAPGPRIRRIEPALMRRMIALEPILHLNGEEARALAELIGAGTSGTDIEVSERIHAATGKPVIVTLGSEGCVYCGENDRIRRGRSGEKNAEASVKVIPSGTVAPYPAIQTDTVGAGDAHAGACLALLHRGWALPEALDLANRLAAMVVATPGALLDDAAYAGLAAARA